MQLEAPVCELDFSCSCGRLGEQRTLVGFPMSILPDFICLSEVTPLETRAARDATVGRSTTVQAGNGEQSVCSVELDCSNNPTTLICPSPFSGSLCQDDVHAQSGHYLFDRRSGPVSSEGS